MVRVRAVIKGRVQGVWYRQSTADEANRLGLSGWVRNRPDGSVEAVFEGEADVVEMMLAWCRIGPPLAAVSSIDAYHEPTEGLGPPFAVKRV